MTPAQKLLLEPFGQTIADWDRLFAEMKYTDLTKLRAACRAATPTNCWGQSYRAALVLLPMIDRNMTNKRTDRTIKNLQKTAEAGPAAKVEESS